MMSAQQITAFNTANASSSFTAGDVDVFVVSVGIVLILTWCAWVAISSYRSLRNPGTSVPDAAGKIVRAVFVVMMVIAVMAL
ncbi:MAG: integrating conjugative element protein (TIGR03758 family) [Halieaceae bacterium]|jgi:integrating conjugative element protein (TIGR03758 family)